MVEMLSRRPLSPQIWTWLIVATTLAGSAYLGARASLFGLGIGAVGIIALVLMQRLIWGFPVLVLAALAIPLEFGTGTEVSLNPATLLVPALLTVWLLSMMRQRTLCLLPSRTTTPLLLFLLAGLLSLLIGNATWDPAVFRSSHFILVQLAQWSIFAFSAGAFWLTANLVRDEAWLWRLTALFLVIAGALAIGRAAPGLGGTVQRVATAALIRAPFWALLAALAGGQLLFNRTLSPPWRVFLFASLISVLVYAFAEQREAASNWVGVGAVAGTLIWLRWPRLRWPIVAALALLVIAGVLFPALWQFAGGDREWNESGGSRLTLIGRVVEVTLRNPVTGLGPAAYRPYANMQPLFYRGAYWVAPLINSHNNYVDLFAHVGLLGLALFAWFCWELYRIGLRLHRRYQEGFLAGYVNAMLAVGAASLVIMALADWILPFVYNIGFPGFQASVLVWLFLGGLVALENWGKDGDEGQPVGQVSGV